MRYLTRLCLVLLLSSMIYAQGMFDLFSGTWSGTTEKGQILELHTESSSAHRFWLKYGESVTIEGVYRVTANKGQPHVSFRPEKISESGKSTENFSLEGWNLKVGQASRAIIDYGDHKLGLSRFDPESQFLGSTELTKK